MDKIDSLLKDIKKDLSNDPTIKEYVHLRNIIQNDEYLLSLEKDIKKHQRAMCELRHNEEIFSKEKALYEKASQEFDANPIVKNYQIAKEEAFNLLNEIKGVLEAK